MYYLLLTVHVLQHCAFPARITTQKRHW